MEQIDGLNGQVVVFSLNGEHYGVDISLVREIVTMQKVTPIPGTPLYMEGMVNLRGHVVPVINLKARLGLARQEGATQGRIVVVDLPGVSAGLTVDEVEAVLNLDPAVVEPPTDVLRERVGGVAGIAKFPDKLVVILDLRAVMAQDLEPLATATQG